MCLKLVSNIACWGWSDSIDIFTETKVSIMKANIPQQLVIVLMVFAPLRPVLCFTMSLNYPDWSYYLTTPDVTHLNYIMEAPIEVWPARLFENYTKLMVCKYNHKNYYCFSSVHHSRQNIICRDESMGATESISCLPTQWSSYASFNRFWCIVTVW